MEGYSILVLEFELSFHRPIAMEGAADGVMDGIKLSGGDRVEGTVRNPNPTPRAVINK